MRKILFGLLFLAVGAALAQAPPPPYDQATVAFWTPYKTGWIAASTTTASIALPAPTNAVTPQIQIANATTGFAFIDTCLTSTCTASAGAAGTFTSDYVVAPGSVVIVTPPAGSTYVAAVLSTSSGAVYVSEGAGQ